MYELVEAHIIARDTPHVVGRGSESRCVREYRHYSAEPWRLYQTDTPYGLGKGKGKVHPRTGHESPEVEQRCNSTLSLTSALGGGWWSTPRPDRFTPGKDTVPIV